MFQANKTHTTTVPGTLSRSAVSPTKTPKYGVTRSQVMMRAWMLAKLNRHTTSESSRTKLGWAMSYAWKEAREGRTEHWDFLSSAHAAFAIEREITALEWGRGSSRYMPDRRSDAWLKIKPRRTARGRPRA